MNEITYCIGAPQSSGGLFLFAAGSQNVFTSDIKSAKRALKEVRAVVRQQEKHLDQPKAKDYRIYQLVPLE